MSLKNTTIRRAIALTILAVSFSPAVAFAGHGFGALSSMAKHAGGGHSGMSSLRSAAKSMNSGSQSGMLGGSNPIGKALGKGNMGAAGASSHGALHSLANPNAQAATGATAATHAGSHNPFHHPKAQPLANATAGAAGAGATGAGALGNAGVLGGGGLGGGGFLDSVGGVGGLVSTVLSNLPAGGGDGGGSDGGDAGYSQPMQYSQPAPQYAQPVQQYTQPAQQYSQPVQQYAAQPVQQYAQLAQQYSQPVQQYSQRAQQYAQPAQQITQPAQQNVQPVSYQQPAVQSVAPQAETEAVSMDLVLEDVRVVEPATRFAGPAVAIKYRNQGLSTTSKFSVAAITSADGTYHEDAPRTMIEVPGLAGGQSQEVTLRLPRGESKYVILAVDATSSVSESDKDNNCAVVELAGL